MTFRTVLLTLAAAASLACGAVAAPAWKIGTAAVDITPGKPVWMAGYSARKQQSSGVSNKLYAKALALDDGAGRPAVLVTTDLLGLTGKVAGNIARLVESRYRIKRDRLLLNSSHTHCGPVVDDMLAVAYDLTPQQWHDTDEYTAELERRVVEAIGAALKDMRTARLEFGHGTAGFAANRRTQFNPNGPVDHDVPVLRVAEPSGGKLRAVVFGYACHNTTLSGDHCSFDGDYTGYALSRFEQDHPGVMALFVTGCGADANPKPRGTLDHARQHGESLAKAVEQASDAFHPVNGPLRTAFGIAELRFATPPTRKELVKRLDDKNEYVRRHARLLLRKLGREGSLAASYPDPVQVWRFGSDLTLIAMGGEVVVDYALRLKKEYGAANLWVAGYSNDVFGYVPSLRVLREGGYEAGGAMMYYGQTGPFDETVEEVIHAKIAELMKAVVH